MERLVNSEGLFAAGQWEEDVGPGPRRIATPPSRHVVDRSMAPFPSPRGKDVGDRHLSLRSNKPFPPRLLRAPHFPREILSPPRSWLQTPKSPSHVSVPPQHPHPSPTLGPLPRSQGRCSPIRTETFLHFGNGRLRPPQWPRTRRRDAHQAAWSSGRHALTWQCLQDRGVTGSGDTHIVNSPPQPDMRLEMPTRARPPAAARPARCSPHPRGP